MQMRKTEDKDFDDIWVMIEAAKLRMAADRIDQWQNGNPNEEHIRAAIESDEGYVLEEDGRIALFCVISFIDEDSYEHLDSGSWRSDGKYASIHRAVVSEDFCGRGLMGQMFEQAERMAREQGAASLRLDTHADNRPMQRASEKYGFVQVATLTLPNDGPRVAYDFLLQ